jgi:uncharacterized damage-inducible protein DinB
MKTEANSAQIEQFLELLRQAPQRIAAATDGVAKSRLYLRTDEEPWSVSDILAHLRASTDVRERFMQSMLTQENPTLRYISPRTYIQKTNYLELAFPESFQAFKKQRNVLLKTLKDLSLQEWSRSATIKDRPETVFSYALYLTQHETAHCEQIEELLK